uniref:Vacuole membrane protein 1 n=1 Tax=Takifugu rubripes TaxID=31033 RepID=A0A674N5N6_TAKRU
MCLCHVVECPLWPLQYVRYMEKKTLWCGYWIGLGILSLVGIGRGQHTFLLYLVSKLSFLSMTLDFPQPSYPGQIWPQRVTTTTIVLHVCLFLCVKAAGSAIGELPPYVMAGVVRLSGADPDDAEYQPRTRVYFLKTLTIFFYKSKLSFCSMKEGFFLQFIYSSFSSYQVPNPSFVPAGLTFVKMHIQVISLALSLLGAALQKPYREYWEAQKAKPHHHTGEGTPTEESWLSWPVERVVVIMVCFFVCSIVSSMAQSCVKRRQQGKCIQKKKAG